MSTPQGPYGPPQQYGHPPAPQPYGAPAPQPYGPPQPVPAGYGAPQPGYGYPAAPPPAQPAPGYPQGGYPPGPHAQPPYQQPPQAQAPYPQAQAPYPQAPYPQAQPPYQQAPYGQAPQHGYPPVTPQPGEPAGRGRGKARLKAVGVVLGVIALIIGYFVTGPSVSSAKAGDCVKASGSRDVSVVKCTDGKANYKVLAKFDSTTDTARCRETAGTTSTVSGKSGRRWNKKRYVLCLGPLTGVPPVKKS
ncbi:LppU/SCO3897 family protein [Kitasatospora sp. NBC_00458]|uniref:LppU/SCO3897 family protein n=1 Tax=Kitasatospora sp. NBC_00458 TaxID=2903568 RepID=UPI002E179AEA